MAVGNESLEAAPGVEWDDSVLVWVGGARTLMGGCYPVEATDDDDGTGELTVDQEMEERP